MSKNAKRALAAGATFVIAGVVNVATGMLTQKWDAAWIAATAVLLLLGGALQAWVTWSEREPPGDDPAPPPARSTQRISGTKIGGDAEQHMTHPGQQTVDDSEISGALKQRQSDTS